MHLTQLALAAVVLVAASPLTPSVTRGRDVALSSVQPDSIHHRAADITLTIANSKGYGGTYQASGTSRTCGNSMVFMTGNTRGFNFEFPYDGTFEIRDVNFAADTLIPGVPTTKYYIDLGLKTKDGGTPSGWILRTNEPKYGETGTVLLTVAGKVATLRIKGANRLGETLDMTVVCKGVVP